jgi:hypothetical protein
MLSKRLYVASGFIMRQTSCEVSKFLLNFLDISRVFKLPTKGIVVPARKAYNEKWSKYFEGGKEKHYKQDSRYIFVKVCTFGMQMRLMTLTKVATFSVR